MKGTNDYYYVHGSMYSNKKRSFIFVLYRLVFDGDVCYLMQSEIVLHSATFHVDCDIVMFFSSLDNMVAWLMNFKIKFSTARFVNHVAADEFVNMLKVKQSLLR